MADPKAPRDNRPQHVPRRSALLESRREREFYRYYEPIQALTGLGPSLCDLDDEDAMDSHQAKSSPDRALTAFCQLGALRLACRRAMLFFFDSNYAYVLAEATRTLSLQDDSVHSPEDELWLGHTVIPRGHTICEDTVCRLSTPEDPTHLDSGRPLSHIIADLDQDATFCGKQYVTGGPRAKFYAGVPIVTPRGVAIGAYCLLDDKKRDGLDAKSVGFLEDMAKTVMTHLEFVRAKAEHERGTRMVCGLGAFIEGAPSMQSWKKGTERLDYRRVGKATPPRAREWSNPTPPNAFAAAAEERPSLTPLVAESTASVVPFATSIRSSAPTSSSSVATTAGLEADPATPGEPGESSTATRMSRQSTDNLRQLQDQLIAPNICNSFQRAADLLREAVDVDGVAFLDSSLNTYGGLVDVHDGSDQSSDGFPDAADQTGTESDTRSFGKSDRSDKACKVLASSHAPEDRHKPTGGMQRSIQATSITERFLRSILRRNPHGKIWNFSEEGTASSDDSASDTNARGPRVAPQRGPNSDHSDDARARRRKTSIDVGSEIQRLFPGVRSLAICGMWDQNRGRWYSACAIWTYSPLRLFSREQEVNYLAAFCDVVMAEVYRLEAQNSDKAKGDFISSISHELRSPLHGILGSVECLQEETAAAPYVADLVSQIEVCGRTLIDIVEHLLDYSKINHQVKAKQASRGAAGRGKRRSSSEEARQSRLGGLMAMESEVALDSVTEEVIEAAVYSFCCAKPKDFILGRDVSVILDIERSPAIDWHVSAALGAWKRVCINLVNNAMKYTSQGFIHISLRAEPIPGKRKRFNAVFTVQDSGRGMAKDFVENYLFTAFTQEDSFMEGTGLGMSLVAKIVKAMSGKIDVQSEQGSGTTMVVTIPCQTGRPSVERSNIGAASELLDGRSVAILGFEDVRTEAIGDLGPPATGARRRLLRSLRQNLEQLGVHVAHSDGAGEPEPDMYLIPEQDLSLYAQHRQLGADAATRSGLDKPLVVVCSSAISVRQLRAASAAAGFTTQRVEYVAQPCGTERLSKAVKNCLESAPIAGEVPHPQQDQARNGATSVGANLPKWSDEHLEVKQWSADVPVREGPPISNGVGHDAVANGLGAKSPGTTPRPINDRPSMTDSQQPEPPATDYLSSRPAWTSTKTTSPPAVVMEPLVPGLPPSKESSRNPPLSGLSLLLVDDNPINLQLLVNYATKQGFRKTTASDGRQAVEVYKAACLSSGTGRATSAPFLATNGPFAGGHSLDTSLEPSQKPQVILMDISMPIMNGFEATRLIRAFEHQHGVQPAHIVALTGLGSASAQQEAFTSGVDLYLTKPVRLKELTKVLAGMQGAGGRADTPTPRI
ncbi:hypothetical protein LTR53_004819 [Teratosphaeriaceae sp. CCFEE 6253]|nr:hypothetical protein LTR53_004819 [Teratosphaeriaceae sp. CCFEE 6253]